MYSRSPANMHVAGTPNGLQLPWEYQCPSAVMPSHLHMDRLKGHPLESLRLLQNASLMVQSRIASDQRFMPLDMSFNQYGLSPFSYPYFKYFASEPKPTQSYIGLIAMAILSSKGRKLVLSDIYQWILDNFPYFRTRGPGWRNSIRHNLSLNDCFMKSGRSPNGKGHFWAIHPACVDDFAKGDYRRRKAQRKVRNSSDTNDHEEEECSRSMLCSESDDASEKDETFMDKEIESHGGEMKIEESVIHVPETESNSHCILAERMDKNDNSSDAEVSPKPEKQNVSRPFDMDNLLSRDSKSSSSSHDAIIRMTKQKYLWTERFTTQ